MNAILADTLLKLIGSFVGDQSPQKNPAYGVANPGDVDPNFKGDPSQNQNPYVTPSWGTRFFHPDVASAETQKNLEGYNALISNAAKNSAGAANATRVAPYVGNQFGEVTKKDPTAAGLMFPNVSAEGILSGNTASADESNQIPVLGSMGRKGAATDIINKYAQRLLTGSAGKEVTAENAQNDYTAGIAPSNLDFHLRKNAMETSLMPSEMFARGNLNVASGEESKRSIANSPALDALFSQGLRTKINEGSVQEALSKDRATEIPLMSHMAHQDRLNTAYNLMHPELSNSPFFRDPNSNTAIKNPAFINMLDMMNARIQHDKMPSRIPLGGGLNIINSENPKSSNLTPVIGNSILSRTHTVNNSTGKEIELPNDPAYVKAKRGILLSKAQDSFRKGIPLSKEDIKFFTPSELKEIYGTK